jgi:GntR family transcriptional regulator/MocR family aminotransferase
MISPRSVSYGEPEGHPRLREVVADYLVRARGVRCGPDQVLIVNGSQQALDLASRVLLESGDTVLMEEPSYHGARICFEAVGAQIVSVLVDGDGLRTDELPSRADRTRLAYLTPSHQFPTGATMCLHRRLKLLEWAESVDAFVFEDDYDSEFRYEGRPIQSLQGLDEQGRVLYAGTFSKIMFPALRIGYLVLPPALVPGFRAAKWVTDRHTPTLNQETLADFISEGHFERHLRRARKRHAGRRATILEALREEFGENVEIQGESAGIHLVAWLRDTSEVQLDGIIRRGLDAGMFATSVAPFYRTKPPGAGLLLGYTNVTEARITEGVQLLARLWRERRSVA